MYKYGKKLILNESQSLITHCDLICALEVVRSSIPIPPSLKNQITKYQQAKDSFKEGKVNKEEVNKEEDNKEEVNKEEDNKEKMRGGQNVDRKKYINELKMKSPKKVCDVLGYELCCEAHQRHIGIAPEPWGGELLPSDYESLGREIRNLEQKLYGKGWPSSELITLIYGIALDSHTNKSLWLWSELEDHEKKLIVRTYGGLFIAETNRDPKNWIYLSLLCNFGKGGITYGNSKEISLSTIVWGKENLSDQKSSYQDVKAQKNKLKLYAHRESVELTNGDGVETAGWASLGGKSPFTASGGNDSRYRGKPGSLHTAKIYNSLLNYVSNHHNDIFKVENIYLKIAVPDISQAPALKKNVISLIKFFERLLGIEVDKADKVIDRSMKNVNAFIYPELDKLEGYKKLNMVD